MSRRIFDENNVHPPVADQIGGAHEATLNEIEAAVSDNAIVVIGMAHNPYVKKARKLLESQQLDYCYLEYGSYTKEWRRRLVIKMWLGWPTFPMIFIKGHFIGGKQELDNLIASNGLKLLLSSEN